MRAKPDHIGLGDWLVFAGVGLLWLVLRLLLLLLPLAFLAGLVRLVVSVVS